MKKLPELPGKKGTIFKLDLSSEVPTFPDVDKKEIDLHKKFLKSNLQRNYFHNKS